VFSAKKKVFEKFSCFMVISKKNSKGKNRMKKIFLLNLIILLSSSFKVFGAPIHSYQELTSAIHLGNHFVILLDLQECTGKSSMPIGYFAPQAIMLKPETETSLAYVTTSNLHFTDHSGQPTYEYVKFTFNSDNTAEIKTTCYDPQNFNSRGTPHTFKCTIGNGVKIHSN
jgi:hypothetical protein